MARTYKDAEVRRWIAEQRKEMGEKGAPMVYTRGGIVKYPLVIEAVTRAESVARIVQMYYSCFDNRIGRGSGWENISYEIMLRRSGYYNKVYKRWLKIFDKHNIWSTGWVDTDVFGRWDTFEDVPKSPPKGMKRSDYCHADGVRWDDGKGDIEWLIKNELEKQRKFLLDMSDLNDSFSKAKGVSLKDDYKGWLVEDSLGVGLKPLVHDFLGVVKLEIWYCWIVWMAPLYV